jgi:hypothetical protein
LVSCLCSFCSTTRFADTVMFRRNLSSRSRGLWRRWIIPVLRPEDIPFGGPRLRRSFGGSPPTIAGKGLIGTAHGRSPGLAGLFAPSQVVPLKGFVPRKRT